MDGLRSLYWSQQEGMQKLLQTALPGSQVLILYRRVTLVKAFAQAVFDQFAGDLSPVQLAELQSWMQQLAKLEIMLMYCTAKKIGVNRDQKVAVKIGSTCPGLIKAAQGNYPGLSSNGTYLLNAPKPNKPELDAMQFFFNLLKFQMESTYPELISQVKCE